MEENIKNFIESAMYYGMALSCYDLDRVIRALNFNESKKWCDDLMAGIPANHPARLYYDKITDENFDEVQKTAFAKMCMWQIKAQKGYTENLVNDEAVDALANEICSMDVANIKNFIQENKDLVQREPQNYNFYFAMLYRYLTSLEENKNIAEYFIEQIDLLENYEFTVLFEGSSAQGKSQEEQKADEKTIADEKYKYLNYAFDNATWCLHDDKNFDLAEKYYKKHINFLEGYVAINDSFKAKSSLSAAYSNYGYMFWDKEGNISPKAEELTYKSIEMRKKLLEEYPENKLFLCRRLSVNYKNIAYAYKEEYKKDKNNEEYKNKYFELYKQALVYAEEVIKLDQDKKIENYYKAGEIYYYIYEDEKAKEYLKIALNYCNENVEINKKWIEKIDKLLANM